MERLQKALFFRPTVSKKTDPKVCLILLSNYFFYDFTSIYNINEERENNRLDASVEGLQELIQ